MRDLAGLPKLAQWLGFKGYRSSAPAENGDNYMAAGSENVMLTGTGKTQAFKGMNERPDSDGGIVMMNVAETTDGYASIGEQTSTPVLPDTVVGDGTAYGNAFNVYACLFFIGKGLVRLAGESLLVWADTTLSLLVKVGGSYALAPTPTGKYQAGLAQPSAPIIRAITPPVGFVGKVNGVVSAVCWRIRSSTGAVSIKSETSNIAAATNESIAITLPLPDANGQDYWGIGVTRNAEGRVGAHFELTEIPESEVAGTTILRTDVTTNVASHDISSATGGFTLDMVGWVVTLTGGSLPVTVPPFESFVTAVPNPTTLTLDAMPPATSTADVHMELVTGVEGTARTVVIEWRDGDLIGKEFAPFRDFPPPEGLYAGAIEDVVFVDGTYADSTTDTSETNRGSAIAPSEPGKPESFSPDSVIFTNDMPTALIRGDGVYYRFGRNSCYTIRYLAGEEKPLSVEITWEGLGISHQHNACLGEGGRLYFWPNERGPMRMDQIGMPEGSFATEIADDLATFTDPLKRVIGWDGKLQVVAFCYETRIWPWFTALDAWGAPADVSDQIVGDIVSCVTENGILLITDSEDNLYEYNAGLGSVMKIRTGWAISNGAMDNVSLIVAAVRTHNISDILIETFADGDDSEVVSSMEVRPTRTGYQRLPSIWPNIQDCESHAVQITMELALESTTESADCGVESITTYGDAHSMLR